jgi:hypothetical protein
MLRNTVLTAQMLFPVTQYPEASRRTAPRQVYPCPRIYGPGLFKWLDVRRRQQYREPTLPGMSPRQYECTKTSCLRTYVIG